MAHQQGVYKEDPAPVAGDPVSTARSLPFLHHFLPSNPTVLTIIIIIIVVVFFAVAVLSSLSAAPRARYHDIALHTISRVVEGFLLLLT